MNITITLEVFAIAVLVILVIYFVGYVAGTHAANRRYLYHRRDDE